MDCKACEEIYIHFFTKHLYELMPVSFMVCLDKEFSFHVKIPKDHLTPEITENLPTNIQLKGPTGQTHEIKAYSTGDEILLARGWSNFVSCYSLRRKYMLIFFYQGNNHFHVKIFDQNGCELTEPRGAGHSTMQSGSRGTSGKGKQVAGAEASSGLVRAKRGRSEHNNSIIDIDSEGWSIPVEKREPTPPELKEISSQSGENADMSGSRNFANANEGPSKGRTRNEKDDSVDFISACSRTAIGRTRKESSYTEEENWSTDSVHDGVVPPPPQTEVITISSGSSHDNGDEVEGICSPNLRVKRAKSKALKARLRILRELENRGMEVGQGSGSGNRDVVLVQKGGRATNGVRYLKHSRYSICQRTRAKHRAGALNVYYDDEEAGADYTTKIVKTPMKSAKKTSCRTGKQLSYTEEESRTTDSVEIVAPPPILLKVMSISSGFFHDNGDEVKGHVKKELDNSDNSDNEATTKYGPKPRFVSDQKPVTNKGKKPDQVARLRSENPYFAKRMTESNVQRKCLNILVKFATDHLPEKHCTITLRLPQGSTMWRVNCRYSYKSRPQWYFCEGWSEFIHDNNLEVGDWCVFELNCEEKLEMKVHIFKVNEARELK